MLTRGIVAVVEHGLFATANFVLNVLLARWLLAEEYGYFAAMFAVLIGIGAIHTALFIEPMLVFGAGVYRRHRTIYIRFLVVTTLFLSIAAALFGALLLLPVATISDNWLGVFALLWATPFVTGVWLLRRASLVLERYRYVAYAGAGYLFIMLLAVVLARTAQILTPNFALFIVGTMNLVVGIWLVDRILGWRRENVPRRFAYHVIVRHWAYGRWSLVSALLLWIPGNILFLTVPLTSGLEEAGALRALFNLALPMLHVFSAVSVVFIPRFVTLTGTALRILFAKVLAFSSACALLYCILLGIVGERLLQLLYASRYDDAAVGLWWMGGLVVASAMMGVFATLLRAKEKLKPVAAGYLAAAGVAATTGILFAIEWGVEGAAAGMVLSYVSAAFVMAIFVRQVLIRG